MTLPRARYALAAIRIVSGIVALAAPRLIIKRFGENPDEAAAAIYGLRLFGVRTVLIGADLARRQGYALDHTIDQAVLIHASDTLTAVKLGTSWATAARYGRTRSPPFRHSIPCWPSPPGLTATVTGRVKGGSNDKPGTTQISAAAKSGLP